MRYHAFSLVFDCDIPLGDLLPPAGTDEHVPPDVQIRLLPVDDPVSAGATQQGPFLWTRGQVLWLRVPGVAWFKVSDGAHIVVEPDAAVDEASLRLFLLGSPLGALLAQRNLLVLHGNAIRIGDHCMVCVGPSGVGKSTLAAAFMQRGHSVLADDIVPIDADGRALAGYPRIKLWQDAADQLSIGTAALQRVRPALQKFHVPLASAFAGDSLPVRWIYVLSRYNLSEVALEPITGLDRFLPLRDNAYRMQFVDAMALGGTHMRLGAALAGRVRMAQVRRPRDGNSLDAMVDTLLADIEQHP